MENKHLIKRCAQYLRNSSLDEDSKEEFYEMINHWIDISQQCDYQELSILENITMTVYSDQVDLLEIKLNAINKCRSEVKITIEFAIFKLMNRRIYEMFKSTKLNIISNN